MQERRANLDTDDDLFLIDGILTELHVEMGCQNLMEKIDAHYRIQQSAADGYFDRDVKVVDAIVRSAVQVPMSQNEYDALVSLVYNMGKSPAVLKKIPRLLSKLNTKDYKGCCDEFADITNHGNAGLVKRRTAEMNIFNNNVYDSSH